ncbi:MAG TPA: hypothetical protein VJP40_03235, partial [bacterium]|nr:hypothetical protein [bacterium]
MNQKEGSDPKGNAIQRLQVLQGVQGMYDLYGQLYPDEMKTPARLREQGELYDSIGQNLKAAGKGGEAKAFFAKAVEQYQSAILANKNDAKFCIQTYKMMGAANDDMGEYKAALIAYSMAAQCEKLRIVKPKDGEMPELNRIKQDRMPGQPYGERPMGNYLPSDIHPDPNGKPPIPGITRVDGLDTLPDWASGPRDNYIDKLKARIDGGADKRAELQKGNPPDQAKILESFTEEAKLLSFFGRDEEATKIGAEAAQLKTKLDNDRLSKEVETLAHAGVLDQKGLDAVSDKENKDKPVALKFGDYVKFETKGGKTAVSFTPAYDALDNESKNRVLGALISAGQRTQISQNVDKAKGPEKLFFEGQLAIFDDNRELAKTKLEQFAKDAKDTKDPKLAKMLLQADSALKILSNDGKQKPEDVLLDMRTMLAPLAMTLKGGKDGGIDLSMISKDEVKTFDQFRSYLADQVSVDGKAFNAVLFASYEKVLKDPKHEALLKQLYAQFNEGAKGDAPAMSVAEMQTALRSFQHDIIDVSASRFVSSHLGNNTGRAQLRSLLEDPTLDKSIKAKLCEEIVEVGTHQGYTPPHVASLFESKVNGYGFWFDDDKLNLGVAYATKVLNVGDHKDVARNAQVDKYIRYPHEVRTLKCDELVISTASVQEMAKLVQSLDGQSDGVSMMKAKLGTMWLTMVDNDNWKFDKSTDRFKSRVTEQQRAEIAMGLKRLIGEASDIKTDADFVAWNGRVRRLLRGQGDGTTDDLAATTGKYLGKGAEDLVGEAGEKLNWVVSKTPEDAFAGMEPSVSSGYNDLLRFVDEVHSSELNGTSVEVMTPDVAVENPEQRDKAQKLIQDLRGMKRGFWYNYQQRNMLSRGISEKANWVGAGDIASIKEANAEIDSIIADVQKAKTPEEFDKVKARLTAATKSGGKIHEGFKESEMDGTEQMVNLVQTVIEIVAITAVTQGLGTEFAAARGVAAFSQTAARTRNIRLAYQAFTEVRAVSMANNAAKAAEAIEIANIARFGSLAPELSAIRVGAAEAKTATELFSGGARLARALGGEAGFATKAATGFKLGAQISVTENVIGSLSGQLRTEPQTLLDWMKDATATGFSMVVSAGLNPTFGQAVEEGVVKGLYQRYVAQGAKGAMHFLGDTGLEIVEEVVDNYVRKKLDGDFSKLSWDELRDITMVCFAGGVKQG